MLRKQRLTRRSIIAGAGAAVASPMIWTSAQAQAGNVIKIGMPLALTGPLGSVGQQQKRGAELHAKITNAKGGILGRKIELLIEARLPPLHRHHALLGSACRRAEARRVELDLHLVRQW
jgi:hypothetical protein